MKKLAVFCSGFGSNLQAIINAISKGTLKAQIRLVVSDKVDAYALVRARRAGIAVMYTDPAEFKTRASYDLNILKRLKKDKIDIVILAGYLRIISPNFIKHYRNRIINIHPALLPSFKGVHGIRDALNYGVKVTGVSVHFVNEDLDAGPLILQQAIKIKDNETPESLARRIHSLEHKLYPQAVKLLVENKLVVSKRKVLIRKQNRKK
ncbi:MAG: phosphoribosylglycinamide formyltransferase [Candidatus Omnitrophota bacterium]